ncbi:hypothetical protein N7532_009524 [Penicillium argentinense]|uniref:Pre-mRNA-processing factor 39 n=1 Tax=Penicillium argentinense TaxID=1131581 RepID=A0A9W9K2Y1_9EURO|nr:uncharacterized protein N7532_009524 [Penicillium argentinense]KAJ5090840.1 hypothetical protein N7532_009524 [Penicillium argentinense]
MSDLLFSEINSEDRVELRKLEADLRDDSDNFETWEKLVRRSESFEGGVNRNSPPEVIMNVRNNYDRFLAKFPLLFGYWKKYADLEFTIGGTEAAEMVYERGIASIPTSVDLWASYCSFKAETSHNYEVIRELFERGADSVGLDFLSHPFWDKYIEFEERVEAPEKITPLLARIVRIPTHQYARYFDRYRALIPIRPVAELASAEIISQFRAEFEAASSDAATGVEMEAALRSRLEAYWAEIYTTTQTETNKRWPYESEITRPYFHVTELDEGQLSNWSKYLDFEETEGSYSRIQFLYERCLVTCAHYDQFWLRYARWMAAQPDKDEEVRMIYQRASCFYVPIANPTIRLQYAYFEEMSNRIDAAKEIHYAILMNLPGHAETIISLAGLSFREGGLDDAIEIYKTQLESPEVEMSTKATLVVEWAYLLWKVQGVPDDARKVFQTNQKYYLDSRAFWESYLKFEVEQFTGLTHVDNQYERLKQVVADLRSESTLPDDVVKELMQIYMTYLLKQGTRNAVRKYMILDREIYGPDSISTVRTKSLADAIQAAEAAQAARAAQVSPAQPLWRDLRIANWRDSYPDG